MASLKVMYDHQIFDIQRFGGISRYYTELIEEFRSDGNVLPRLSMGFSGNNYLTNHNYSALFTRPKNIWLCTERMVGPTACTALDRSVQFKRMLRILSNNQRLSVKAIDKGDFDIFHPTYFNPYFLPHLKDRPFVLTIYDMIHERFAADVKGDPTIARKRLLAERAEGIIAISESTKRDVVDLLEVPANKVHVTLLASSLRPPATSEPLEGVPERYVLYVGHRGGYKNFIFMLQALDQVFERHPDLHLICVGGKPFTDHEQGLIGRSKGNGRIWQMSVSDEHLARLYSNAMVYINPSQYEGFGIPVLEAMICRCPTLISRVSSLPEVGGPAAHYFEVNDKRSFQDALIPLIEDEDLRERAREEGVRQASRFSWQETARMTKAVYRSVVDL